MYSLITKSTNQRTTSRHTPQILAPLSLFPQIYCKTCEADYYTLLESRLDIDLLEAKISGSLNCQRCPYGAKCDQGIRNQEGFWGEALTTNSVVMHICPQVCVIMIIDMTFMKQYRTFIVVCHIRFHLK